MEAIALADIVVVMDQGQIEQAASAREVYDLPRTRYVARFMGGQNVLSGTVGERGSGHGHDQAGPKQVIAHRTGRGTRRRELRSRGAARPHPAEPAAMRTAGSPG